jgi:uncharacterized protein VirK/YbjX
MYDGSPRKILDNMYYAKVEVPRSERALALIKDSEMMATSSEKLISVFLRREEISKIKDFLTLGEQFSENVSVTRPTLEEGYIEFLRKNAR